MVWDTTEPSAKVENEGPTVLEPKFLFSVKIFCPIFTFLVLLLFGGSGIAQTLKDSASIMQVRKEPRHHDVVDNQWVRILDVRLPPGDTTFFHKHSTPSVFLVLGNTKTGSQTLIEPRHRTFDKEDIWFEDFTDTPRIHRVWNADTKPFHTIDIELPHQPNADFQGVDITGAELLFDAKSVLALRMKTAAHTAFAVKKTPCPIVVVLLSGNGAEASVSNKQLKVKGDFAFIAPGQPLTIHNTGATEAQFGVFEIK